MDTAEAAGPQDDHPREGQVAQGEEVRLPEPAAVAKRRTPGRRLAAARAPS